MSRAFEEIDHQPTPMGDISLRRRREPTLQVDVYEVKLGDEFLMSSLFTATEEAVARLGLAATSGDRLDIVVGGLGLGHTAKTALDDPGVARRRRPSAVRCDPRRYRPHPEPPLEFGSRRLLPDTGVGPRA